MSTDRLKVLHLLFGNVLDPTGGMELHVRSLCRQMKNDMDITVLGTDEKTKDAGFFLANGKIKRVERKNWIVEKGTYRIFNAFRDSKIMSLNVFLNNFIGYKKFVDNVLTFMLKEKFDIVHIHDATLWWLADTLKKLYRCKIVLTAHLAYKFSQPVKFNEGYRYAMQTEGTAYHRADRIITVSDYYKKRLVNEYWLNKDRITVINNGVDIIDVKYNKAMRRGIGYDKLVVFVGRLVQTKGIELIIKAIKKLKNCYFVLISEISPTLEDIDHLSKQLTKMKGRYNNFVWYPQLKQSDKLQLMKIADIGIMPSLHEPFGITALEWMSLGVPLIVTKTGGLQGFCNDWNSILIERNSKSLIKAIKNFKRNEDKIKAGHEFAKIYTWKKTAQLTKSIYEEVLK